MLNIALVLGGLLLASSAAAQSLTVPFSTEGYWRFEPDSSVVEFSVCGTGLCAQLRVLPPKEKLEPGEVMPKCGATVIRDLKPAKNGTVLVGTVVDPATNKQYRGSLQPAKTTGRLNLTLSALGGLISETYAFDSVAKPAELCAK